MAKALSGGKPTHSKIGKTIAPPAPAIELIKPAMKATTVNTIKSSCDSSIFFSCIVKGISHEGTIEVLQYAFTSYIPIAVVGLAP